ncbi:MAG: DUF4258 domain-containing protein [Bacteroidetes bacterium]|jgi:hypothetical protein|nr:DUF4258 domain-containing protein [Bacteroidota bacterium]
MKHEFTKHCLEQIKRRGITKTDVLEVLQNPDKIIKLDDEVMVYQSLTNVVWLR